MDAFVIAIKQREMGWKAFIFILMTITPIYKNSHCEKEEVISFSVFHINQTEQCERKDFKYKVPRPHKCAKRNICHQIYMVMGQIMTLS